MATKMKSQIMDIEQGDWTGTSNNNLSTKEEEYLKNAPCSFMKWTMNVKGKVNEVDPKEEDYLKNAPSTFMNWMENIEGKVYDANPHSEEVLRDKLSIYKVPGFARDLNPKNFTPQLVSFGPYHHGKGELGLMEVHKERALLHFLKRAELVLDEVVRAVECMVEALLDSYELLDGEWRDNRYNFLKLMITDGCFMLELLQFKTSTDRGYPLTDPFFSEHGMRHKKPYIRRDMLMIENQLPLVLLKKLVEVENRGNADNSTMHNLLLKFVGQSEKGVNPSPLRLHLLELFRMSLLIKTTSEPASPHGQARSRKPPITIPNATSLHEAGITFTKSTSNSLQDIHFDPKKGVLHLPLLVVDDATECTLLNIIAFEHLHTTNVNHDVSSYVSFMDEIIDSASDVSLLRKEKILQNSLGSDKAVAGLFNQICKEVTADPDSDLMKVRHEVQKYCRKKYNTWRANLCHNYFYSPWSVIKLLGAVLVIALTVIQTGYAIAQFQQPRSDPPSLAPAAHNH